MEYIENIEVLIFPTVEIFISIIPKSKGTLNLRICVSVNTLKTEKEVQ